MASVWSCFEDEVLAVDGPGLTGFRLSNVSVRLLMCLLCVFTSDFMSGVDWSNFLYLWSASTTPLL